MRRLGMAAAVLVLALGGAAYADVVSATATQDNFTGSGAFIDNIVAVTSNARTLNNQYAFDKSVNTAVTPIPPSRTLVINVVYGLGQNPAGETTFDVYTGPNTSAGNVRLIGLTFYNSIGGNPPSAYVDAATISGPAFLSPNGRNRFVTTAFATPVGGFNIVNYNSVLATFEFTSATSRLDVDLIANPEPGTLALFGLGAMGLGGLAWRRRKALAAAKQSS